MLTLQPLAPLDSIVSREKLSELLTNSGFPVSYQTLCRMAAGGSGPRQFFAQGLDRYNFGNALKWAEARTRDGFTGLPGRPARTWKSA